MIATAGRNFARYVTAKIMSDIFDKILAMPFYKWLFVAGVLMAAGAAGAEYGGFEVPLALSRGFLISGFLCFLMSFIANGHRQQLESKRQEMDMKMRLAKLEAGLDPKDDQTVIGKDKDG